MRQNTITTTTVLLASTLLHTCNGQTNDHFCDASEQNTITRTFSATQGATLFQEDVYNGIHTAAVRDTLIVGKTINGTRRALLKFDLDDIPSDARITCAEMRLTATKANSTKMEVYRVTGDWSTTTKSTVTDLNGALADVGDATWVYARYPIVLWDTLGGDFDVYPLIGASAASTVDYANGNDQFFGGSLAWADAIQQYVSGTRINYGFALMGAEESLYTDYTIYDGVHETDDSIPSMIVSYTTPSQGYPHIDDGTVTLEKQGRTNSITGDDDDDAYSSTNKGNGNYKSGRSITGDDDDWMQYRVSTKTSSASNQGTIDTDGTGVIVALVLCSVIGVSVLAMGFISYGSKDNAPQELSPSTMVDNIVI